MCYTVSVVKKGYRKEEKVMVKYTVYMGLFDKDSKRQEYDTITAYKMIQNIATKTFDGATISEANGIYKHDNGDIVVEPTIRIELLFTDLETVKGFCNELKGMFNQESIVLQVEEVNSMLI